LSELAREQIGQGSTCIGRFAPGSELACGRKGWLSVMMHCMFFVA